MWTSKKKTWHVKCVTNRTSVATVIVNAKNERVAKRLAEEELVRAGHMRVKAFYCEEVTYGRKNV